MTIPQGKISILADPAPGQLKTLESVCDVQDKTYTPLYTREQIHAKCAAPDVSTCLALQSNTIVGFAVLSPPSGTSRWARCTNRIIRELSAVEVARHFRQQGIATRLLSEMFSTACMEDRIICLSAYAWLWDLAGSGMSLETYRRMLLNLYTRFGFVSYQTNEPNICLKPENVFMARIGKNISPKEQERFKWLRFGITSHVRVYP
jgi:acetoin utilization protein AcuA